MFRALALLALLVPACVSAGEWVPQIYPLRDRLIPAFELGGEVDIQNAQEATETTVVYKYGFVKLTSNYKAITQTMVEQARGEVAKNGQAPAAGGPSKSISLKVVYMHSDYKFMYWTSRLRFEATLGDGTVVSKEVPHSSGNPIQDLNGCIAESVMMLLRDEQVRAYLASPAASLRTATTPAT
jgi:hypothetical protein